MSLNKCRARFMWKSLVTTATRRQAAGSAWMVSPKYALPTVSKLEVSLSRAEG
jgi:hypothetical protein